MTISARGHLTKLGYKREALAYAATWPGTAIAVDSVLPILPGWSHNETPVLEPNSIFAGHASPSLPDVTGWRVTASGPLQLKYDGLNFLWLQALGYMPKRQGGSSVGVTMPELMATGVYKHLYEIDDRLVDQDWTSGEGGWVSGDSGLLPGLQKIRRATYALSEQIVLNEYRSLMVNRLTLAGTPQRVQLTVDLIGYDKKVDSSVNTVGSLVGLSLSAVPSVTFSQLAVRVGAASGSVALNAGDVMAIDEFEIILDNGLIADQQDSTTGLRIMAPERQQEVTVSGRFRLPRFQSATQRARLAAQTELMADLSFTGGTIPGTASPYQCHLYLPSMLLNQVPGTIANAGPLTQTLEWTAYREPSARAGFPVHEKTGPLLVELQNAQSAHPLL